MNKFNILCFAFLILSTTLSAHAKESPLINIDEYPISVPHVDEVVSNISQKVGDIYNHNIAATLNIPMKEAVAFFKEQLNSKKINFYTDDSDKTTTFHIQAGMMPSQLNLTVADDDVNKSIFAAIIFTNTQPPKKFKINKTKIKKSKDKIKWKEYKDVIPGVSFSLPKKGSKVDALPNNGVLENKYLTDVKHIADIQYEDMKASLISFEIAYDVIHGDWLLAYGKKFKAKMKESETVINRRKLRVTTAKFLIPALKGQSIRVALAIAGNRGYFIQGKTSKSNGLVKGIALNLEVPGKRWGTLDPKKEILLSDKVFQTAEIFKEFSITDSQSDGIILSTKTDLSTSSIVLIIKTNLKNNHKENRQAYEKDLTNRNAKFKVLSDNPNETAYGIEYAEGGRRVAYLRTKEDSVISLLIPAMNQDVNAFLNGRFFYLHAVDTLKLNKESENINTTTTLESTNSKLPPAEIVYKEFDADYAQVEDWNKLKQEILKAYNLQELPKILPKGEFKFGDPQYPDAYLTDLGGYETVVINKPLEDKGFKLRLRNLFPKFTANISSEYNDGLVIEAEKLGTSEYDVSLEVYSAK